MKKFLLLLTLLLTLSAIALSSCNSERDAGETDTSASSDEDGGAGGEIDLTKYTIMRSDSAKKQIVDTAIRFKKAFTEICGFDFPIATDYVSEKINSRAEYEIIIGHTNIPEENAVYETLGEGEFAIAESGTKLIIVGDSDASTEYAVNYFLGKYIGFDIDKYENEKVEMKPIKIVPEKGKVEETMFSPLRKQELDPAPKAEYIELSTKTFEASSSSISDGKLIIKDNTRSHAYRGTTGEGSYSIGFTAKLTGESLPIVQLFFNQGHSDAKHIVLSVSASSDTLGSVGVGRSDYERGGASFTGDPTNYTLRADVYPSAGMMRYFVNDVFLGEMNVADNDYPLIEDSKFSIAAVGKGTAFTAEFSDIFCTSIPDVEPRRYDAIDHEVALEAVYPKSENKPAETIYVVDPYGYTDDELLTLVTLQGNVNRTTPEIFVDYRKYNNDPLYSYNENEAEYLKMLESKGRKLETANLDDLLVKFADRYEGVIIGKAFGENNYEENIITTLCGVMDGVYLPEARYNKIKGDIKKDVLFRTDGKFASSVDAYMWAWENYGDKCSKDVIFHMGTCSDSYSHPTLICRDYAVMNRAFVFCTDDVRTLSDYDFYMSLFASTAPNTGIIGQGGGCFPEFEMFQICGQFGKYFTYGFSTPNMSCLNTLEIGELKQPEAEIPALEKDTLYVAFDLSEGDNLSWDYHLWMHDYADIEGRGAVAKGYSICGALYYVAPAILEYYYQNATPNDNFFLDGGGASNCSSPDDFGILYKEADREKVVSRMLEVTEYICKMTDIHVIRAIHNISDEMTARYDNECPSLEAVLSAYGNLTYRIGGIDDDYSLGTYMVGDIVRERCAYTTFREDIAGQIKVGMRKLKNDDNIHFARVFVYANAMLDNLAHFTDLKSQLETLDINVKIVTPEVYAALYKEYRK